MSSDDEDIFNLPTPFTYLNTGKETNQSYKISLINTNKKSFEAKAQTTHKEKFLSRDSSLEWNKNVDCPVTLSFGTVLVCFGSVALQSNFGLRVYDSVKKLLSQVHESTKVKASCIYWSRDSLSPLIEAPFVHLCSAEEFFEHCITERSLLDFAQILKDIAHGGRIELILYGYQQLKHKSNSACNSRVDASHLERIKEFALLLYVKEYIHCLWMDDVDQVATYVMHITRCTESLLRKGPRERTMLSEFGNNRRFARSSKALRSGLKDIYKLILERSLGRRSKAVEVITTVYPTLYHLRNAVSKNSEEDFIREFNNKLANATPIITLGNRTISAKLTSQIYRSLRQLV